MAPDAETAPFDHLLARDLVFERELSAFESAREFLFKHALLRDVAYDSVLRARRREYHRRAARWWPTSPRARGGSRSMRRSSPSTSTGP